jgi:hypothetical protein
MTPSIHQTVMQLRNGNGLMVEDLHLGPCSTPNNKRLPNMATRSSTSGSAGVFAAIAVSVLSAGCGQQSTSSTGGTATVTGTSIPPRGWQYHNETDKMRGTTDRFATLASNGDPELQLEVRDLASTGGMDVLLVKDGNTFTCGMACQLSVKFDGESVQKWYFSDGSTHGLGSLFVAHEYKNKFLSKLKAAKHLVVELSPENQAEFDVAGLTWQ